MWHASIVGLTYTAPVRMGIADVPRADGLPRRARAPAPRRRGSSSPEIVEPMLAQGCRPHRPNRTSTGAARIEPAGAASRRCTPGAGAATDQLLGRDRRHRRDTCRRGRARPNLIEPLAGRLVDCGTLPDRHRRPGPRPASARPPVTPLGRTNSPPTPSPRAAGAVLRSSSLANSSSSPPRSNICGNATETTDAIDEALAIARRTGARIIAQRRRPVPRRADRASAAGRPVRVDRTRARDPRPPRRRGHQHPDRHRARHLPRHRAQAPRAHLREAARVNPHRGRRARREPPSTTNTPCSAIIGARRAGRDELSLKDNPRPPRRCRGNTRRGIGEPAGRRYRYHIPNVRTERRPADGRWRARTASLRGSHRCPGRRQTCLGAISSAVDQREARSPEVELSLFLRREALFEHVHERRINSGNAWHQAVRDRRRLGRVRPRASCERRRRQVERRCSRWIRHRSHWHLESRSTPTGASRSPCS